MGNRHTLARGLAIVACCLVAAACSRPVGVGAHGTTGSIRVTHAVAWTRAIVPGIAKARAELGRSAKLTGPIGAETAYRLMRGGTFHGVVAMYHDQATIPMKLVAFGDAVNVTMGLSVPRTSVDHGTAYDIAWTGKADPAGMIAAMTLGKRLAEGRRPLR